MQSRDYLKKQFDQISNAIAKSLANLIKTKFDTKEERQDVLENQDNIVLRLLELNISEFNSKIEELPVETLQNLSLLLFETSTINEIAYDNKNKINAINTLLSRKHNTLDFNHYLRNSD